MTPNTAAAIVEEMRLCRLAACSLLLLAGGCGDDDATLADEASSAASDEQASDSADASEVESSSSESESESSSGEATVESDSSESDASTDSTGADFVTSDIGEPSGQCSPYLLDDCDEGRKCAAVNFDQIPPIWHTNSCVDIMGDKQVGDECSMFTMNVYSGLDDCANGSICLRVDKWTEVGVCAAFRQGSEADPFCPDGQSCFVAYEGVMPVCVDDCDPLAQDCAHEKDTCLPLPSGEGYGCFFTGVDLPGDFGEPCGAFNFCKPGLVCVAGVDVPAQYCHELTQCCTSYCDMSAGLPCPGAGQHCEPVFEDQPPGFEEIGVCRGSPILG